MVLQHKGLCLAVLLIVASVVALGLAACTPASPSGPTAAPTQPAASPTALVPATAAPAVVATAASPSAPAATAPVAVASPVPAVATKPAVPASPPAGTTPAATAAVASVPTLAPPTPAPQANCVPLDPMFESLRTKAQNLPQVFPNSPTVNCPQRPISNTYGAIQEYRQPVTTAGVIPESNYLIWREDTKAIYVIAKAGQPGGVSKIMAYQDTFADNQPAIPESCATITPPQDITPPADPGLALQVPRRGFGKVWCEGKWQEKIGFGVGKEIGLTINFQDTAGGLYMSLPAWGGRPGGLFLLDIQRGGAIAP
jgi:hypothetical protein